MGTLLSFTLILMCYTAPCFSQASLVFEVSMGGWLIHVFSAFENLLADADMHVLFVLPLCYLHYGESYGLYLFGSSIGLAFGNLSLPGFYMNSMLYSRADTSTCTLCLTPFVALLVCWDPELYDKGLCVAMLCFSCLSCVIFIITCCLMTSVFLILLIPVTLMLSACWRLFLFSCLSMQFWHALRCIWTWWFQGPYDFDFTMSKFAVND